MANEKYLKSFYFNARVCSFMFDISIRKKKNLNRFFIQKIAVEFVEEDH
jgi:hypothetical protein